LTEAGRKVRKLLKASMLQGDLQEGERGGKMKNTCAARARVRVSKPSLNANMPTYENLGRKMRVGRGPKKRGEEHVELQKETEIRVPRAIRDEIRKAYTYRAVIWTLERH
jgi:hypothetical protein